jgi:tetratricopeptide (TPR) repeat protein
VLDWFGAALTSDDRRIATTWATSVERLSPESRRLLDRLATLAADPIPDSLIDVAVPGEVADSDTLVARAGLYAFSLIARATGEDGSAKGFVMRRLVQDLARRAMTEVRRDEALREALGWVDAAFVADPEDVRSWPVLDPLAPHALAVARRADEAGIATPTGGLFNEFALLSKAKARYAEAEPLCRRALAIGEATLRPDDPELAAYLNNLANLLQETNRPGEAEPLYRRTLAIWKRASARIIR